MAPSSPRVALRRVLGLNNGSIAAIRVSIDNTLKSATGTVPPMIPRDKSTSRYDGGPPEESEWDMLLGAKESLVKMVGWNLGRFWDIC